MVMGRGWEILWIAFLMVPLSMLGCVIMLLIGWIIVRNRSKRRFAYWGILANVAILGSTAGWFVVLPLLDTGGSGLAGIAMIVLMLSLLCAGVLINGVVFLRLVHAIDAFAEAAPRREREDVW